MNGNGELDQSVYYSASDEDEVSFSFLDRDKISKGSGERGYPPCRASSTES